MVAERLFRSVIYAEALAPPVVVHPHGLALPVLVAFDSEMIVAFNRKGGKAGTRLEDALGQGNAGGYAAAVHLADRSGGPTVDIALLGSISRGHEKDNRGKGYRKEGCTSFHMR